MLTISELFIYPIKSLGGISLLSATITDRGFKYDRRWMLVDENNRFLTQREHPAMALLQVEVTAIGLKVFYKMDKSLFIRIPFIPETTETATAQIWDDRCEVQFVNKTMDTWFSERLNIKCRLVYMPDSTKRKVDEAYAASNDLTCLSDGFPLTMISQASLDDLNSRLKEPVPMNRFRPNIVFTGGKPFEEDEMEEFYINNLHFYGVKPCARCVITTINQDSAEVLKEPLKTLSGYRARNNKVYFGQNVIALQEGAIKVGYQIKCVV